MAEPVLVQLGELAALPGMPVEATLRKIIRDHADFPVVSRGKNGVAYEIDLERAVQWFKDNEEKRLQAQRERADELQQFAFDLLGADAASDQSQKGLTAAERKALYEEELLATKLAERKGELIRKASVEEALAALIVKDAQRRSNFSARLAKRIELPRDMIIAIDALMEIDRKAFAADLETMSETGNAAPLRP
jgi:hypothetical protein